MFGSEPEDPEAEDVFLQVPVAMGAMQLLTNAVGGLVRKWGGEIVIPYEDMGSKVDGVSIYVFHNPKTKAVKLVLDDPRDPRITPGVSAGHA